MNRLDTLWLTEAVSLRERQTGALEDSEANRHARRAEGDFAQRVEARALWLAKRDGLVEALAHWKQGARLGLVLLAVVAMVSGAGMAATALAGAPAAVNVFWATGSLLGLNLLLLLAWLVGLLAGGDHGPWLGRVWLGLGQRLARDAKAAHLGAALVVLLHRHRLNRWLFGATINGLWTLCLLASLITLLLMFATRRYDFVWETTLLHSDTFVALTAYLGKFPGWLGFPMPAEGLIRASGDGPAALEGARQAWAGWLVGILACYGVFPRAALAAACWLRWRHGAARLGTDLDTPEANNLRERLMPSSEHLGVSDLPVEQSWAPPLSAQATLGTGALIVGIELDDDHPWPPVASLAITDAGILDDRQSRQRLLEALAGQPADRLLLVCDPRRSPDRGTQALLAELSRNAAETRVWLIPPPADHAIDAARWADWLDALAQLRLPQEAAFPLAWLEHDHA